MKVLWFTNTPSNYLQGTNAYNGGGWISSLEIEIKKQRNVELGVAFLMNSQPPKINREGVCYYPIENKFGGSFLRRLKGLIFSSNIKEKRFLNDCLRVIEDFRPDIINVFGTEQGFGLVSLCVNIPVVIHLQGLLAPYLNAYFPPGYNILDYIFSDLNPLGIFKRYHGYFMFKRSSIREKTIFQCNSHFIGRTNWDREITSIFSPYASYDYCSEILRESFYTKCERAVPSQLTITSTISSPLYKGFDVVLKCAKILKEDMNLDFRWRVFGNINPKLIEWKEGVLASDTGVFIMGVASQEELLHSILTSTLYVHPSYIDNSPNSVCEAQMVGCTVVGQNVGGMSTLVKQGETGLLVPANDPYLMAFAIRNLFLNPSMNMELANNAKIIAQQRHNKGQIVSDLIKIYEKYSNK